MWYSIYVRQASSVEHAESDNRSFATEVKRRITPSERRLVRPRDTVSAPSSATSSRVLPAAAGSCVITERLPAAPTSVRIPCRRHSGTVDRKPNWRHPSAAYARPFITQRTCLQESLDVIDDVIYTWMCRCKWGWHKSGRLYTRDCDVMWKNAILIALTTTNKTIIP